MDTIQVQVLMDRGRTQDVAEPATGCHSVTRVQSWISPRTPRSVKRATHSNSFRETRGTAETTGTESEHEVAVHWAEEEGIKSHSSTPLGAMKNPGNNGNGCTTL